MSADRRRYVWLARLALASATFFAAYTAVCPTPEDPPPAAPTETPAPQETPAPEPTVPQETPAPSETPSPEPTAPQETPAPAPQETLSLPRIAWEGGPEYWSRFPDAVEWTDPSFFPIVAWYAGVSSDEEVAWDTAHGINTYIGMWEGTPFSLFEDNDVYWIGDALNETFDESSPNWPGVVLDDEIDGRVSPEEGFAYLGGLRDAADPDKFAYANYSQLVIGPDLELAAQERYVNAFTDVVSLDMYWYTIPFCDWTPYRGDGYAVPVPQETCRTASSYGRSVASLGLRDAVDGILQPRWQFVENLNGLSGQDHVALIEPDQLKGAAMSSLINEARGLLWFNQSFTGDCRSTNVLRTAQIEGPEWCGAAQVEAMGEINGLVRELAPVLNTQSYAWEFGAGLDTMLKVHDGTAYVFAMTDGTTGTREFRLPPEIDATRIEVHGEGRTLTASDGVFVDVFPRENSYHVYRIVL